MFASRWLIGCWLLKVVRGQFADESGRLSGRNRNQACLVPDPERRSRAHFKSEQPINKRRVDHPRANG